MGWVAEFRFGRHRLGWRGTGGLVPPAVMGWQDPQVDLAAAAADKSSVTHHDIADFVTKDTIDELIVAREVHAGSQLVVKTGSKDKIE